MVLISTSSKQFTVVVLILIPGFQNMNLAMNSTLTYPKNLTVFTLYPGGNRQIFLLTHFKDGVNQEKNYVLA